MEKTYRCRITIECDSTWATLGEDYALRDIMEDPKQRREFMDYHLDPRTSCNVEIVQAVADEKDPPLPGPDDELKF